MPKIDRPDIKSFVAIVRCTGNNPGLRSLAVRNLLGQAASLFEAGDDRERGGRHSWDDLPKWKERNPHIASKVVGVNVAGQRRK